MSQAIVTGRDRNELTHTMDGAFEIPDPTDWLETPLVGLAELENGLHCQICKEFYDTPMITSCSHSFCSKCIRTSLSADGKCPACRALDQASKLRNNWALQELVNTFVSTRTAVLAVARRAAEFEKQRQSPSGTRKRRSDAVERGREQENPRRKSRRLAESSQNTQVDVVEIDDASKADDGDFQPEELDDGLVECPLGCGKRMKIEAVDPHLDRCEDEKKDASRQKSRTPLNAFRSDHKSSPTISDSAKPPERLSELNYSMMKENALAKKMRELGIPSGGGKPLMMRRHTEWVNIWNANCDSSRPRSKHDLLRDLDVWERTQGGRAPLVNGQLNTITRKDFDGAAWASRNKDDFSRLIADARRRKTESTPEQRTDEDESKSGEAATEIQQQQTLLDKEAMEDINTEARANSLDMSGHVPEATSINGIEHSSNSLPLTNVPMNDESRKMPMFTVPETIPSE